MSEERKRSSARVWIGVAPLALLIAYALSCPWTGIFYESHPTPNLLQFAKTYHAPLMWVVNRSPEPVGDAWIAYRDWCCRRQRPVYAAAVRDTPKIEPEPE